MIDDLKVFDAIIPEEMNVLMLGRMAFDAVSSFQKLTTDGRNAFEKSFPKVAGIIEGTYCTRLRFTC
jgi:hypothetical protein